MMVSGMSVYHHPAMRGKSGPVRWKSDGTGGLIQVGSCFSATDP